jgi:preprotein translocase subunit SecA
VDEKGLASSLHKMGLLEIEIDDEEMAGKSIEEIEAMVGDALWKNYDEKVSPVMDLGYRRYERAIVLRVMDMNWVNHIDMMDKLRNGIGLRSYAQENPLKAYVSEGYQMFEDMMANIANGVVNFCMNLKIRVEGPRTRDHKRGKYRA